MKALGHKNINNTLVHTQLVDFGDEEYTVRVAHSIEENKQLIEVGFEYVAQRDSFKIYRKRKCHPKKWGEFVEKCGVG